MRAVGIVGFLMDVTDYKWHTRIRNIHSRNRFIFKFSYTSDASNIITDREKCTENK